MGIIELLTRVGEDNIKFQNLVNDMAGIQACKGGKECRVTFFTGPEFLNPSEVATGKTRHCALVLWLPRELVNKAKSEGGVE